MAKSGKKNAEKMLKEPKIIVEKIGEGKWGKKIVCVQWHGDVPTQSGRTERRIISYVLPLDPQNGFWRGRPELFRVFFFGKAKDYPKENAIEEAVRLAGNNPECYIVCTVSGEFPVHHVELIKCPATLAMSVLFLGANPAVTPTTYINLSIIVEEQTKVNQTLTPAEKILQCSN